MSKDDNKVLYSGKFNYTFEELTKLYKVFPSMMASYYLVRIWIMLTLGLLLCVLTDVNLNFAFIIICCIVYYIFLKLNVKRQIKKNSVALKDESYEFSIFENYLLVKGNFREFKYFFGFFDKVIETDTNFYFYNTKMNRLLIFVKNDLDSSTIKFLKAKFVNLDNKSIDTKDKLDSQGINKIGLILESLFALSIGSLFFTLAILTKIGNKVGYASVFEAMDYMWIFWCFLPIPILTIILGFKYKNSGIKTSRHITTGIIMSIILITYGCFCFSESPKQVDLSKYEEILGVTLPSKNDYFVSRYNDEFNNCESCVDLKVVFTNDFKISVESKKWVIYSNLDLAYQQEFINNAYGDVKTYYMVYDKTTDKYNQYPEADGRIHETYFITYVPDLKILDIKSSELFVIDEK